MNLSETFAYDPSDTDDVRLEKVATFLVASSCSLAGLVWTVMYYAFFGWGLTTFLPFSFAVIVPSALVISHVTKNHRYAIYAQIICIIYISTFLQWSIGDAFNSGFVLVWALLGPICALMFFSIRQSILWLILFLINLVLTVVFNDYFASRGHDVSESTRLLFFLMNLGVSSTVVFIFASYYVNAAIREHEKTNKLLRTNLQQEIALRQSEKLATLGRLSAGVAHELNNPVAATQRSAVQLKSTLPKLEQARFQLGQMNLSPDQRAALADLDRMVHERGHLLTTLDSIERSDKEYALERQLQEHGMETAWQCAPILVQMGFDVTDMIALSAAFPGTQFSTVIHDLSTRYATQSHLEEIEEGASRITEIVKALKTYTYLDQAPLQFLDIHSGLENTLVLLRSRLSQGVTVHREYAADLPQIQGYGSELNQVWTNVIDNAIDAMEGTGDIWIRTYQEGRWMVVEIADSGPGIPEEIAANIFDPFYTTKPPGKGTGLGLNISHNIIVQKHQGDITFRSQPDGTRFIIKLPLTSENVVQSPSVAR